MATGIGTPTGRDAPQGAVTIILATHNRPDALRLAIASVRHQTCRDWNLLVIGDCCDPRTGAVVAGFDDPRIRYINLPDRSGEQSGPNAVGMALAETPFIAFLNHDDLWLPDHLAAGLARLAESGADFFAGRAVFVETGAAGGDALAFRETTPDDRSLAGAFFHTPQYFEPASAWILRRCASDRVGPWRASTGLYRTPLEDWVLRAWRKGIELVSDDRVTVVKPRLLANLARNARAYDRHPPCLDRVAADIIADPEAVRTRAASARAHGRCEEAGNPFRYRATGGGRLHAHAARLLNPASAMLYRWTGIDLMDRVCRRAGRSRGQVLRRALGQRTGETLPERPALAQLLCAARDQIDQIDRCDRDA